jgi:hypothetical protein
MKNLCIAILLILLALVVACTQGNSPTYVVVIGDRSGSTQGVEQSAIGVIQQGIGHEDIRRTSRVIVLGTGDRETAFEPLVLGSFEVPVARRVIEGRHQDDMQVEFMGSVQKTLNGQFDDTTNNTPLYLAVRRGLETLSGLGCGSEEYIRTSTECTLYVVTDGEETVEKRIRKALDGEGDIELEDMVLDNAGVRVRLCGYANTNANTEMRNAVRAGRLEEVWKGLFTHPEMVVMEPFCPAYNGGER